ncbi:MAG: ankyrin repeat domain-containing protein [Akkermansia sp.]|nr:ankyrin repeat domain-containing protein [Akkermansia sp.]
MPAPFVVTKFEQQSPELPQGFELMNYTIERKLGRGGFGITYLARESVSDRPVVIKENFVQECSMRDTVGYTLVPSGDEGRDLYEWALKRFLDEAKVLIRLSHPCIVQVLTVFKALGTAYYVMPLVKGAELDQAAPAPGKINEAWLRPVLEQLLGALDYLHRQGLLHRDIKPSNILLRPDGSPLLIDFGTARVKDATHTLTMVGTPGYSPSEQFTPHGKNGPWTDLYSLGATCYRLITGEVPQDCISRLEDDDQRPLAGRAELKGRFSHKFLTAIDKAMSVARRDRWQSAQEWLAELGGRGLAVPVLPPVPELPAVSDVERKKKNWFFRIFVVLLFVPIVICFLPFSCKDKRRPVSRELLISKGLNPDDLPSALEVAQSGNDENLRLILYAGMNENAVDSDGSTPLHRAAERGFDKCVKVLLEAGADEDAADDYGKTPLHRAAYGNHAACVRLLLEAGADEDVVDNTGWTPLHRAAFVGSIDSVRLLLEHGADVNDRNDKGETPLTKALQVYGFHSSVDRQNKKEIARLLRAMGAVE